MDLLTSLLDESSQVTTFTVFEDKVEVCFVLGRSQQLDDEGVVHLIEQILLTENVALLAKLHDLLLVDLLDSDSLPSSDLCRH